MTPLDLAALRRLIQGAKDTVARHHLDPQGDNDGTACYCAGCIACHVATLGPALLERVEAGERLAEAAHVWDLACEQGFASSIRPDIAHLGVVKALKAWDLAGEAT